MLLPWCICGSFSFGELLGQHTCSKDEAIMYVHQISTSIMTMNFARYFLETYAEISTSCMATLILHANT